MACLLHRLPGLKCLSFRVPFSLPPIPRAAPPAKPARDLGVIAEEDENEEDWSESHSREGGEGTEDSSDSVGYDSAY